MRPQKISVFSLIMLSIGSMVGSGWLFGSFYAAKIAGPAALISWILGAACVCVIAFVYAEVSTMLPLAGGSVTYMRLSHGRLTGTLFAWITWLWTVIVPPIEAGAAIQYGSHYIPGLMQTVDGVHQVTGLGIVIAGILLLLLTVINLMGVNWLSKSNNILTFLKLVVPVGVIFLLFQISGFNFSRFVSPETGGFMPYGVDGVLKALSGGAIAFSFFGFQSIIFLGREAENPQKSIPLALFGGLIICTVLYVLLQTSFIMAVPDEALKNGWKALSFAGDAGPFAGILAVFGFAWIIYVLNGTAVLSAAATANGFVAATSRILYSMGIQNDAPKWTTALNRSQVPYKAILVNFVIGMLCFVIFSGWQSMVMFLSSSMLVTLTAGPLCVPVFRQIFPTMTRTFKLPAVHAFCLIAFYMCNLLLFWAGWETLLKLYIVIGIGISIYVLSYFLKWIPRVESSDLKSFAWVPGYLLSVGFISYYGPFGGKGIFDLYMGFVYVALSSIVIYVWAQMSAIEPEQSRQELNNIEALETTLEASI